MTQTRLVRSLGLATLVLMSPLLVACGGDESDEPESSPSASETSSAEEDTANGIDTQDCRVAAVTWADRAASYIQEAATSGVALGQPPELPDTDDLISEMSVICSPAINDLVTLAMEPLLDANYELTLCSVNSACDAATTKIRRLTTRAEDGIELVRLQAEE